MLNSETLEIGIGMAFLFLLMSLICTGVKEWIEGIFKWRAMDLERALRTLLDDESGYLTAHLLAHPMVSSLFQGGYDPTKLKNSSSTRWMTGGANARHMALSARRNLPSYIPATHFATALIDLVGRGPAGASGESTPHTTLTVAELRERAASLNSPFLRRAILTAIDHSAGELARLTDNLQRWFDGSMDRASGWYKRRTQSVLFILGLAAAAVLNVDALYVMTRLTSDKNFREVVVSAAAKAEAPASAAGLDPLHNARTARKELEEIGMPIGWQAATHGTGKLIGVVPLQMCHAATPPGCADASRYSYVRALCGWLITAFAVMLGAPFWFDVLNKFMVIRSTVKPHEKSGEEGSEDRIDRSRQPANASTAPSPVAPPAASTGSTAPALAAGAAAAIGATPPYRPEFVPHEWRNGIANPGEVQL